jgi:putative oxidoreductase
MKRIFQTTFHQRSFELALLFTRLGIASFMLEHGIPKFKKLLEGNFNFADPLGFGEATSLVLTVFAEVICSVFIFIGLGTRLAVIPLIITMLVAIFLIHNSDGFGKQELAWHYLLVYGLLFITGSGKYSVDYWLNKKTS